ncbi:hypothetical protein H1O16_gp260 [Burkholderia phage BcepSaruman]|uniref:Uncharacterized protein n=1 Tax=Burkholderia phage BcepSaruman TaxID=2530032 RepID=A0A4D5ZCB6_9CAUD|nr:hypothetical protein H1O16_gp260 [Burkholderia phage BcepSaruman]QBX06673.1 hypothetical protein BcepSaruman_260 [Burkholderia phage BcepSaruman]
MGFKTQNASVRQTEDYGSSYYVGVVTANNDPLGLSRVQANVPGLMDTAAGEVPWIGSLRDSPFGYGTGPKGPYGWYGSPQVGSKIKAEAQGGDILRCLYTSLLTKPDMHPWFTNPQRWGYVDPSGNSLQVDMAAGTWVWTHVSGDQISYDGSGNRVNVIKANETTNVQGSETHNIQGSLQFNVSGNATVQCSSFNLQCSGNASYSASTHQFNGPVTMSSTLATGGDITDQTASGNSTTVGQFRTAYRNHYHHVPDNPDTSTPIPQF